MSEKGVLPCRTSQTHSMPSCPPVATMCCWFGCLSTQCIGTLSPDLKVKQQITTVYKNTNLEIYFLFLVTTDGTLQGENLGWCVALLSEVPQLELANGVHCQNFCCPQVRHSMNGAAVCILCPRLNSQVKHKTTTKHKSHYSLYLTWPEDTFICSLCCILIVTR